jgi:hypothetical protein
MEPIGPLSHKIQLPCFKFKIKLQLAKLINRVKRPHHNYLFEFHHNNNIFLAHIGSGSVKKSTHVWANIWKQRIREYLKKHYP